MPDEEEDGTGAKAGEFQGATMTLAACRLDVDFADGSRVFEAELPCFPTAVPVKVKSRTEE